jgi:hypothetical protein
MRRCGALVRPERPFTASVEGIRHDPRSSTLDPGSTRGQGKLDEGRGVSTDVIDEEDGNSQGFAGGVVEARGANLLADVRRRIVNAFGNPVT